jgi:shikimate kinase
MNIALYGFPGAGKTTLGKALATKLDYKFIDLDDEIEMHEAMSIEDIFEQQGEIAFRRIEHQVLKEIIRKDEKNLIMSLGGGAIINPTNRKLLEIRAYTNVYIDVVIDELINRLKNDIDNRPLLKNIEESNFEEYTKALFESRKNTYEENANIIVHINNEDFETSLEKLYLHLNLN